MKFYRYEWREYASIGYDGEYESNLTFANPKLELRTFEIISETPKGYWIGFMGMKLKWIPKQSRNRYAYPSQKEALEHFIRRTTNRIEIMAHQLRCCQISVSLASNQLKSFEL